MIGAWLLTVLPVAMVAPGTQISFAPFSPVAFTTQATGMAGSDPMRPNVEVDAVPRQPSYKLSGELSLRPARISDDGTHMYLEWTEDQALPAVFALNARGDEEMVDGYMRQGIFTIDRVHNRLVFRIDKKSARAERTAR
jgi:type IV secretory pathway VirB9-like protein